MLFRIHSDGAHRDLHSFPTRRSSDLEYRSLSRAELLAYYRAADIALITPLKDGMNLVAKEYCRSEEHTSELQSRPHLVCRLLLEKKKQPATSRQVCAPHHTPHPDYLI